MSVDQSLCPTCFEEVDDDGTCPNTKHISLCVVSDFVSWRTPNQEYFIVACQACGKVASSITDFAVALKSLVTAHNKERES